MYILTQRLYSIVSLMVVALILSNSMLAQTGSVRGFVLDEDNGAPVMFANVTLLEINKGVTTNEEGFFNISNVPVGTYTLYCSYVGYDSAQVQVNVKDGGIVNQTLLLSESAIKLKEIEISGRQEAKTTTVQISKVQLTTKEIKSLPSAGGEADLAQYLQVLPGVIFTGDQGGQLYIRGGSPVQNKILLDGMTIYNPFHSIGFFSVFETEIIQTADVMTGGFNAEYGGRTSAVVNITSRDGNKNRFGGLVSASPFQSKVLLEGPIKKLDPKTGGAASFIITGKSSYLDRTSPVLYEYASPDSAGLPFSFTDIYGKLSITGKNGNRLNLFGFNFIDNVSYTDIADIGWTSNGVGANFKIVPSTSEMIVGGHFSYSNYDATYTEADERPRTSGINGFEAGFDFTFYGDNSEIKYGLEVNGTQTTLQFVNPFNITVEEEQNNTEIGAFLYYRKAFDRLVIEPSVRVQYYASLSEPTFEPRIGLKYNMGERFRLKFAGGLFTQNLISTVNEQDIVNLFVGFLSSPESVNELNTDERTTSRLQRAIHGIAGIEIDLAAGIELNIEPYVKNYTQLINLNRNKQEIDDPNFRSETGLARGIDFLLQYNRNDLFVWVAYSLGSVTRNDGEQEYFTNFDRRHNLNFLTSYTFGADDSWEASIRWNFGTGFPFTLTQGFYQSFDFQDGINSDYITGNGDLGIIYSEDRNSGRLPTYHRLDASLKKHFELSKYTKLTVVASVTNVYDRRNIFYFDRIRYERVNQLPVLPSLGITLNL